MAAAARPTVDLEKELTCSICTELLYQPLTLLDCLHTFCGACLKEWFSWQAAAAEGAPTPPAPGTPVFTCPSCRAAVRDSRHNATVATLLEMFLAASPDKGRTEGEKVELDSKYKRGEQVLPRLRIESKTSAQRRAEEEERRLLEEVREMSLREAGVLSSGASTTSRPRRSGEESRPGDGRARRSREPSRDARERDRGRQTTEARSRRHTRTGTGDEDAGRNAEQGSMLRPEQASRDERRRRRSESRQRSAERRASAQRHQVEHQSSIRSLISSSDIDSMDIEREIEEFARQIQEEGLLNGLDLDNIDLNNNDELSRKITEAYRRRQRERARHGRTPRSRSNASGISRHSEAGQVETARPPRGESSHSATRQRAPSQPNGHSRSSSNTAVTGEHSRYPPPANSNHLEVLENPERRRRRTTSSSRSATVPVESTQAQQRPASRSQTDLSMRLNSVESAPTSQSRPSVNDNRISSSPTVGTTMHSPTESPSLRGLPFSARAPASFNNTYSPSSLSSFADTGPGQGRRTRPVTSPLVDVTTSFREVVPMLQASPHTRQRRLSPPPPAEPSIACTACGRKHIEYELHYNCRLCKGGNWNICLSCYRSRKGCLHWYGFGYGAYTNWERTKRAGNESLPPPHKLVACRYLAPSTTAATGETASPAGLRAAGNETPAERLQSGTFCMKCFAWANNCYWQCDTCNEGDWGFCNDCVNWGRCCTHPLLPLTYEPPQSADTQEPRSPPHGVRPSSACVLTGTGYGPFRTLTFTPRCQVCRTPIPQAQHRYHCFACPGTTSTDLRPGDYDLCQSCYSGLVSSHKISPENGPAGWRRCPQGHRMVVVACQDFNKDGLRRVMVRDLIGGRKLKSEPLDEALQRWSWYDGKSGPRWVRLVTRDAAATVATLMPISPLSPISPPLPSSSSSVQDHQQQPHYTEEFPPEGGMGKRGVARWAWFPDAGSDDEISFPKNAEIREVEDDVDEEWCFGVYMGAKGLFPKTHVWLLEGQPGVIAEL